MKLLEDILYHIVTRLTYSGDTDMLTSPIVLPNNEPLILQLIEDTHRINCHAGAQFTFNKLREGNCIIQGRRTVNRVIRKCVICRRFQVKAMECDPSPLPAARIETKQSFETTGVNLAGRSHLKGGKKSLDGNIHLCSFQRGISGHC